MSGKNVESQALEANKGIHDKDVQANQNATDFTNVDAKDHEEVVTFHVHIYIVNYSQIDNLRTFW